VIDYGAGRGHGTSLLGEGAESFEPYPNAAFRPTYTDPAAVPSDHYAGVVNLNVLNVLPPDLREQVVREMARVVRPQGQMVVTTRGRDVMAARGEPGPEPMSLVVGQGDRARYQKGFTQQELREYLQRTLGDRFAVDSVDLGPAGAVARRLYAAPVAAAPMAGEGMLGGLLTGLEEERVR
jgi:SAM-dependent methyltransferase